MKVGTPERLYSYSQDRLYRDCPMKYKFRYIDNIQEPSNKNLELGTNIHKLFETYINQEDNTEAIKAIDKSVLPMYTLKLRTEIDEFYKYVNTKTAFVEQTINTDKFTARIDLISQRDMIVDNYADVVNIYTLTDFKVTKKPKTEDSVYEEGQLLFYKWLFHKATNYSPDYIYVQYVNISPFLKEQLINPTELFYADWDTCTKFVEQMDKNIDSINKGDFPKHKKWCNWCFYKDRCENSK